jgi:CRISPR-associated protein (TIGR02584 family)
MSRTLVMSVGLSPQVVTETIWWLSIRRDPAWTPDTLVMITTREGARRIDQSLLGSENGRIAMLGRDHGRPDLMALAESARTEVIADDDDAPFNDIDSDAAHQATADRTFAIVRELTSVADAEIHASIAGGRKSQGAMLALSMALFGRPGDSLSHIVIDDRFAGRADFFYPPPAPLNLPTPDGVLGTGEARVRLATIPFPRLRARLPRDVFGSTTWADAILSTQRALDPPRLAIRLGDGVALINDTLLPMPKTLFAWLAALARDRLDGGQGLARTGLDGAVVYRWRGTASPLPTLIDEAQVQEWTSRLNKLVRDRFGPVLEHNLIERVGRRPHSRYRLAISLENIAWQV